MDSGLLYVCTVDTEYIKSIRRDNPVEGFAAYSAFDLGIFQSALRRGLFRWADEVGKSHVMVVLRRAQLCSAMPNDQRWELTRPASELMF